ncbi:MAG: DegT/DnrJ/EryC1/StrS family aminotransferase [Phycisphaerales bacterium]|nr:DegT/DnrJ/EryC1/StrS family aminotransferase [Phycisphaerae bacterium]NNM25747.1 DegT/DnrJ/EryC1/StrS family aminotransferase [Phycisphaerales bacterium]
MPLPPPAGGDAAPTGGVSVSPEPIATPACLGGTPCVTAPQDEALRWPILTADDEEAVLAVLRSGALSINPEVAALEDDVRGWLGVEHVVAHNNGTSAIHAALHAFDLQPGDEVIVPSATWWASVMPVLHHGAVPVFAETETATLGLDPADVGARITDRTKAIVVVHLFGMPSRMDELMAVARRHGLRVLEDAAHAHGARFRGRPAGTIGDAGVFSFQSNKLVPSAEGGVFVTNDDALMERVVRYGHYERLLPMKQSPERRFAATGFGHKFRMSPLSAAVARGQLRHLEERNARRNAACERLSRRLVPLGIDPFLPPADVDRVYFEFLVSAPASATGVTPATLARALQAEGARVGAPRYPLLHQQPMFTEGVWAQVARLEGRPEADRRYDPRDLPRTTAGNANLLKLPSFPAASDELIDQYATAFEKAIAHATQLPQEPA